MTTKRTSIEEELNELFPINESTKAYLYRIDDKGSRKQVFRYDGMLPDDHEIGMRFGGGEFLMMIKYRDDSGEQKQTTKKINLDESYNSYRDEKPQAQPNNHTQNNNSELGQIMSIMVQMMERMNQPQKIADMIPNFNLGAILQDTYTKANNVLEDGLIRQQKLLSSMMMQSKKQFAEMVQQQPKQIEYYDDEEEYEEEEENNMRMQNKMIFSMVKPYIPQLIGGLLPQETIEGFKSNPLFSAIINNPQGKKEFESLILEEFDFDTLATVRKILGL